jgi:hypothetical protein
MKVRMTLAALAAALIAALVGTGAASALVAPGVNLTTAKVAPGGNGDTAGTGGRRESKESFTYECVDSTGAKTGDTITYSGTTVAWPPNHKYRPMTITAVDKDEDGTVELTTSGSHDQMLADGSEMNGAGNTDPVTDVSPPMIMDAAEGTNANTHQFRGERSGRDKSGRTYTWTADAVFDADSLMPRQCSAPDFHSTVPHDQGQRSGAKKRARR